MKTLKKHINFKKICTMLTLLSFLLLNINSNLYALTTTPVVNNQFNKLFETTNLIQQGFGKVTSFKDLGSNITVINIQDLHCHLQTQKNINNIIKEIDNIKPIDSILAEGGYENFNLSWITDLKDKKFKEELTNKLLSNSDITGTEYYALTNNKENILKGLDNNKLHQENLSRLNFIINNRDKYSEIINQIKQEIFILNNKYINQKNRRFSRILNDYNNGKISSTKFYKILFKYIQNINKNEQNFNNIVPILIIDYPNISKYLNIYSNSNGINPKLVSTQLQSFVLTLKNNLPYSTYDKLLTYTDNFSNTFKLADFIKKYSQEFNIDISLQFPELNKFFINLKLSEDINPITLLKEEEHLISQIRMSLSYDNTEYEITFISDFFSYFEKYLNYSLTAYDWQYYKENFDKFTELYSKYSSINRIKSVEQDFKKINSYYETNNIRNDIFVSNIISNINTDIKCSYKENRDIITTLKQSSKIIVVVAGGFHSEELKDYLIKKKINTITITPTITQNITDAQLLYEQNVKLQNKVMSQALALRMAASAPNIEQKRLLIQAALEIYGDNDLSKLEQLLDNKIEIDKLNNSKYKLKFEGGKEIIIDKKNDKNIGKQQIVSSLIKNAIDCVYKAIPNFVPTKGLQSIFIPETYSIFKNLSLELFNHNIYLSDGVIFNITKSKYNGQPIDGIQPEIYSTFLPEVQQMLLDKVNPKPLLSLTNKVTLKQVLIEELFRVIPMTISILNPLVGIPIFFLSQVIFICAHLITNYMHTKNPDKTISFSDYFKQLTDILFNYDTREAFKDYLKKDTTKKYIRYIEKKTFLLSLPYLCAIALPQIQIVYPLVSKLYPLIATLTAIFFHYKHNKENLINTDLQEVFNEDKEKDHDIEIILIITLTLNIIWAIISTANPIIKLIHFISLMFPLNSFLTLIWSLINPKYHKRIFGEDKYESKYFSNIPEEDYDYSQGTMDVTIQIPVYKESNEIIFETIRQSIDAITNYKGKKFGAKANVVVSDDGLAVLLDGEISKEHIELLMQSPTDKLTDNEKQAVERIRFYREHHISFVARPKDNRAGLFKKASNLNHTYRTIDKMKKGDVIDDGTYYEGTNLEIYDIILMLDKDSGLHKDILSVSVPKFIKDDKLAYTENVTVPSNRGDNYFSKTIAAFTSFLYQYIYPTNALTGGIVPFVGHNGFIRRSTLEEIGYWPEDRVSEDYYTSTLFSARGYHGQYLHFKGYEFKEMVSRSFIEEASKISRYTFGLLELIFNKKGLKDSEKDGKGLLTDWMKEFLQSKDIKWYQKIHFFVYPLSYFNIISIIPVAIISGLVIGSTQLNLNMFVVNAIPLILSLYKIYTETNLIKNEEKTSTLNVFKNILRDVIIIAATFISFSYTMTKGLIKFFRNPNSSEFGATNVDNDNFTFKEAKNKIKEILKKAKSIYLLFIPFVIKVMLTPSSFFDIRNTILPLFITFAYILSNILLNPFFIKSIFKKREKTIKLEYYLEQQNEKLIFEYPLSIIDTATKTLKIYISNNTSQFDKKDLINTGLKVNDEIIWQYKKDDKLIFVADGLDFKDIAKTINNSRKLKKQLKKILNLKSNIDLKIEAALIVDKNSDDVYIEDDIFVTTTNKFSSSFTEILRVVGVVFAQKMMVSLADTPSENLYQAISNCSIKKAITKKQFEYLKNKFEEEQKDILQELISLRERGIELYIISESDMDNRNENKEDNYYMQLGISGKIKDSIIYDYFSQEEIELENIPENIQIKELEKKIIYSQKPLLVNLKVLQRIFSSQNNILDTYNAFDTLLGKIKIKLGLKKLSSRDIKEFAYNIKLSQIPSMTDESQIEFMLSCNISDFTSNLNIHENNIVSVILNDTKISNENKEIFLNIIKQRMLVKLKFQEQNIENINDNKMERLLGELLLVQYSKTKTNEERNQVYDKIFDDIEKERNKNDYTKICMKKINELYNSTVKENNIIAINTIIEIILFMQDRRIEKIETKQISTLDYRQMLAAA